MTAAASLKQMRTIYILFLVALALYVCVSELVAGKSGAEISAAVFYGMTIATGVAILNAMYFRRAKLIPALEKLRRDSNDAEALKQWRAGTLLSMTLVMSVALCGFTVRFMGAPRPISWLFYGIAFLLLLAWRPNLEVPAEPPGAQENQ